MPIDSAWPSASGITGTASRRRQPRSQTGIRGPGTFDTVLGGGGARRWSAGGAAGWRRTGEARGGEGGQGGPEGASWRAAEVWGGGGDHGRAQGAQGDEQRERKAPRQRTQERGGKGKE